MSQAKQGVRQELQSDENMQNMGYMMLADRGMRTEETEEDRQKVKGWDRG
jgi:hypothetical protein